MKYNELYTAFNYPAVVIIVVGMEKLIREVQRIIINGAEFDILSKSATLPYLLQYERDLLEANLHEVAALYKKWYWIPFDYYGADEWDRNHFLTELMKTKDVERKHYLQNYQKNILREQEKILQNRKLSPRDETLVRALPQLNFIQDERKRVTNISYPFLHKKIFNEVAKRLDIPKEIVWFMTPAEIRKSFLGEKKDFSYRKKQCVLEVFGNTFTILRDIPSYASSDVIDEQQEIMKGTPASSGRAIGKVRVCISSKDISQMQPEEILVAPATTPDFILGFKKAAAVVTDEGGLISHAAVVSRELKLPCVIGTKIASKILKTGDVVEVDGSTGNVKIIKRNSQPTEQENSPNNYLNNSLKLQPMTFTKPFEQITKENVDLAGGKGASLGEMTNAGIPVPPGFVILSTTFDKFIDETGIKEDIDAILHSVDHKEIHTVENASEKIKAIITSQQMPEVIAQEINEFFVKLNAEFVAVRSSATAEDSSAAAWAGQLDTYLNTTKENLLNNVKKCWSSLFTPRAIFYRFEKGLHDQYISVAVVVQKMVNSEISGVAFSVHPVTQNHNQLIIEAGFGLGESIVSGQITPDSYIVEKKELTIFDVNVSEQRRGLFRKSEGGNEWKDLSSEEGGRQKLTNEQILELSKLVINIEEHYGFPCDIEWAVENDEFYITQSRPITTLQ